MKNAALALGWIIALILGAALYMEYQHLRSITNKLEQALAAADPARLATAEAAEKAARVVDLEQRCADLQSMVDSLKEKANSAQHKAAALSEKIQVPEGFSPVDVIKDMARRIGDDDNNGPPNPFQAMFQGEQGEALMKSSVGATVSMQYGDLFNALDLPEDRMEALKARITEHMEASAMAGLARMRGEETDVPDDEALMDSLRELLDPDDFETFRQYQEALPERMLRQQYEMQLRMLAPGLSEASQQRTLDVIVEHMLDLQDSPEPPADPATGMAVARASLEAAAAQLAEELPEEDAARIQQFFEQQLAGLDMVSAMMGEKRPGNPDTPEGE